MFPSPTENPIKAKTKSIVLLQVSRFLTSLPIVYGGSLYSRLYCGPQHNIHETTMGPLLIMRLGIFDPGHKFNYLRY